MYVYIHVYIYIHLYTYIYIYICMYTYLQEIAPLPPMRGCRNIDRRRAVKPLLLVWQFITVCFRALQCVAVFCSVLQRSALLHFGTNLRVTCLARLRRRQRNQQRGYCNVSASFMFHCSSALYPFHRGVEKFGSIHQLQALGGAIVDLNSCRLLLATRIRHA